jgi:DNA-binding NarL/FixJ family response regulator
MLSGSVNIPIMRQVVRSGAAGFVTKSSLSDELLEAIKLVLDGGVYRPQQLEYPPTSDIPDVSHDKPALTQRQELVLRGLLDGRSNREISETLNISDETVKSHVTAILRHFAVQNRTQAVVAAARRGYRGSTSN